MDSVIPRLKVPELVRPGIPFVVKSVIAHPMETGRRRAADGTVIPRRIITRVEAAFAGQFIAGADWYPGIAANPYWEFHMRADLSETLTLTWREDTGRVFTLSALVVVA